MTREERVSLLKELREVLARRGIEDGILVLHKGEESLTWVYPGCPSSCPEPERCAAKAMELTAAYLEDRVDELLERDTSETRAVNTSNVTKH